MKQHTFYPFCRTLAWILFVGMPAMLAWACSTSREASKTPATLTLSPGDSAGYEILIIDQQFDQWYLNNYAPAKDRANDYYRGKLVAGVANWNDYYRRGQHTRVIECHIDFQPGIDYGIDVNRKLFWYFKYIQTVYGIRLLS